MAMLFIAITLPMSAQDNSRLQKQAKSHLQDYAKNYQLSPKDVGEYIITDEYTSKGITHTYFRQSHQGIEVFGANAAVHSANGQVISSNNDFIPALETRIQKSTASLSAIEAVENLAKEKGYAAKSDLRLLEQKSGIRNSSLTLSGGNISRSDIPVRLVYQKTSNGSIALAWNVTVEDVNSADILDARIDANTGKVLDVNNWTVYCDFGDGGMEEAECTDDHAGHSHTYAPSESNAMVANSYNVFPYPIESPNFGSRSIVANPEAANTTASPDGWHEINGTNYTVTRGNNTDTYLDDDANDGPTGGDAARVDGGANLEFDFPWTAAGSQASYRDAALTNLFYWTNVTHDVWYNYGFDEASGNFQEYNFNRGGNQGDGVLAEAQDGEGTCNANFGTPADGGNPRMQMFLCNSRDGDYDNGVVVHEYGHGISTRLTGGPASPGCLSNQEQMGEGWSDWFGNMMTIEAGDQGSDSRGMGTWLFGQGANGGGIRPFPYSTDLSVNPMTYATIGSGVSVPHGVGSVWATMLWDMSWAFIDEYGYDADIYNGTGGNNMAMALVIEGLKLQPCSPGFVDGRDAILAADQAINGGANQCMIWEVFARRGLGFSANQGSSSSVTDGTEAFDMPPTCSIGLTKTASVTEIAPGGQITYTLTATNNTGSTLSNVVISDDLPANTNYVSGGSLSGNTVSFSAVTLATNASVTRTFTVEVDSGLSGSTPDFSDDMESGAGSWTTSGTGAGTGFGLQTATANSGSSAWFAADVSSNSQRNLTIAAAVGASGQSTMSFTHSYNTENNWDGGLVEISTNGGTSWSDLGSAMTANGYNGKVNNNNSSPAFSGNSNGFLTTQIDLSAYDGQSVLVRFRMSCDASVSGLGWYIDDVMVGGLATYIPNTAQVTDGNILSEGTLATPTLVVEGNGNPPLVASASSSDVTCNGGNDGSASVSVTGGTGTYTYAWSSGATTAITTGLAAGTYTVTINDGDDTTTATVTVNQPNALVISVNGNNTTCGDDNGTASATGASSYSWNNGATSASINGLSAGTYTVTGTDANGCTATASVTIGDSSAANVTASGNDTTCGDDNGTASATGAASYSWSNGDTGAGISGLSAGTYTVTGTTADGCTDTATVTIGASSGVSVSANATGTTCGDNNGSASATGATTYSWSNGATGATISGLPAGTYTVTGTTNGCSDTATVTVGGSNGITVNATATDAACGNANGTASATGATTYSWSNGATGASISGLSTGTYTVTGTSNGCTATATVTVSATGAPSASISGTNANGGDNGAANLTVSGGAAPFTYVWSNGATSQDLTGLAAGTYSVVVTDANGCTVNASVIIGDDTPPPTGCTDNGMTLTLVVDNYPQETDWELTDASGAIVASAAYTTSTPDGSTLVIPFCVTDGCYDFTINDAWGDGICCGYGQGSYEITDDVTGEVLASGAAFGSTETTEICFGNTPLPPVVYCGTTGTNQNYEYIQSVTMGNISNNSGNDGGYGDYSASTTSANVGDAVSFTLTPGFAGSTYSENWRVWVDFNRDGDFTDAGEEVYAGASTSAVSGSFTVPAGAANGDLRIRVSMKWGSVSTPCESFTYGEVEDYTLLVGVGNFTGGGADERNSATGEPEVFTFTDRNAVSAISVYPNPVSSILNVKVSLATEADATIVMTDLSGRAVNSAIQLDALRGSQTVNMDVSKLNAGIYFVQLVTDVETITERFVVVK